MKQDQHHLKGLRFRTFLFLFITGIFLFNIDVRAGASNASLDVGENSSALKQNQDRTTITGQVYDESKLPLIGVSIQLKGSNTVGTMSDIDGKFEISIPSSGSQILVFTYLGMEQVEMLVGKQTHLRVEMKESSITLGDVVIEAGYGLAQKRSDMVGSAFQVSAKDIKSLPSTRVDNLLEGLVPGMTIGYNSDSEMNVRPRMSARIRGEGSLNASSEPIWIVDGIRIYSGERTNSSYGVESTLSPLSYIDPNDIESLTVLKDPSTIALYGADGSNGVILVTTKKGTVGRSQFNASVKYGISRVNNSTRYKVLNGEEYMTLAKESYLNQYMATDPEMRFFPYQDVANSMYSSTSTNWYDEFFHTGSNTEASLSYNGGSEKIQNYISASFFKQDYAVKGNDQERFSVRANTDVNLTKKLKFSVQTSFTYNTSNLFSPSRDYYEFLPIISPYNDDGSYRLYYPIVEKDASGNPLPKDEKFRNSLAVRDENDNRQRTFSNKTNALLRYNIIDGLNISGQFGIDYNSTQEDMYKAMTNWSGRGDDGIEKGYSQRGNATTFLWNTVWRANYDKTFGKHTVGALIGFEASSVEKTYVKATGNTFANDHIKEVNYAVNKSGASGENISHVLSYLGQASYSYDHRYYLTANTRRDGNSNFGEDVQWAQFWSIGGSWNIHNEEIFNVDAINVLKLKASYGTSGNSRLGDVRARGLYKYGYIYNGAPGSVMSSIQNKKLSWETSYMTNLGIRARFLDRFDVELEVYNKKTEDMISNHAISMIAGESAIDTNIGSIQNRGLELTIESLNVDVKDFKWSTSLNMAHTQNKILKLEVTRLGSTNKVWAEGGDKNAWYLVRWAGVNPRNGEALWYDKDGNITNTFSVDNAVPYKTSTPTLTGGMVNTFEYKDFSLRVQMLYSIGGYSFSTFGSQTSSDGYNIMSKNQSVNQLDRWRNPGDLAISPKPLWGVSTGSTRNSTRYLYNTTHLRLKNIALGYNLPSSYLKPIGVSQANVQLVVDNIAIWTPYDKSDRNSYRQSMSGYPLETAVSVAVGASF